MDQHDRIYTVRWYRTPRCLASDPQTTWRWASASKALKMTLEEATHAAARMGGIVCVDGVPLDRIGQALPTKPKPIPMATERRTVTRVREHVQAERWREAFRLAKRLKGLGGDMLAVERAWMAVSNPSFCRQIGLDPDKLMADGQAILRRHFVGSK
jgi:hypothetical protein